MSLQFIIMEDKTELIQIRVDGELKDAFYKLAEKTGQSPSNLLRSLMRKAIELEEKMITELVDSKKQQDIILYEILSFIHKAAMLQQDNNLWELYKSSYLPEYLDEMIGETLRNSNISGDQYWRRFWEEVDKNWFTKFGKEKPLITSHLKRNFMDEIREGIKKKNK